MNRNPSNFSSNNFRRAGVRLMQVAALAVVVAVALPVHAADQRAVKSRVNPSYPVLAQRMRITGTVRLEVTVSPDGKVTKVKAISGNSILANAAESAVRQWKFEPGPAISVVEVALNFDLAD